MKLILWSNWLLFSWSEFQQLICHCKILQCGSDLGVLGYLFSPSWFCIGLGQMISLLLKRILLQRSRNFCWTAFLILPRYARTQIHHRTQQIGTQSIGSNYTLNGYLSTIYDSTTQPFIIIIMSDCVSKSLTSFCVYICRILYFIDISLYSLQFCSLCVWVSSRLWSTSNPTHL